MAEEWLFEYLRRFREEVNRVLREVEASFRPMADFSRGCLMPLYEVSETPDSVIVRVDLPRVRGKDDISITVTENRLVVEARLSSRVSFDDIVTYSGRAFEKYSLELELPAPVDAERARARFAHQVLEVVLPKKIRRYQVRVE